MPITFKVANHDAEELRSYRKPSSITAERFICEVWSEDGAKCDRVLESSFTPNGYLIPKSNGFINTVVDAYNEHYHLIIRPDDLWIAILSQFNFYINAHAEELRSHFVSHEGKEKLVVGADFGFGAAANDMGELLKTKIKDPSLYEFIVPTFSTTTPNDKIICSVMMMSTLKAYFSYEFCIDCGIPSITLEGEQEDYAAILKRLDKLEEFGNEPTFFARLLRPIIRQFISAFDAVKAGNSLDVEFWNRICHYQAGGSGPSYLSGWITAFAVWNSGGKWQAHDLKTIETDLSEEERKYKEEYAMNPS
ncbi:SubName: Full=Uncharacterized protein {ECO:0000313/EMBL:CCA71038.1} [Serendipita indica DSM 11827]|nr:SubName: Full=Uncharacterized protein {ECO:0000313/EMBL:CCA71038.1} [Serendipita indica DSM 11827]